MAHLIVISLALVLCASQAWGSAVNFEDFDVPGARELHTHYIWYVHSLKDAASKAHGPPTVTFDLKQRTSIGSKQDDYVGLQAYVMPMSTFNDNVAKTYFCTGQQNGSDPGRFYFKGGEKDASAVGYDITGRSQPVTKSLPLDGKSEAYVLVFINCGGEPLKDVVKVAGTVTVKNPHGYTPATEYPKRVFYAIMAICYIAATGAWAFVCIPRWHSLLTIQQDMLAVGILGAVESASFFVLYEIWNQTGNYYFSLSLVAVACYAGRLLVAFRLLIISSAARHLPSNHTDKGAPSGLLLETVLSLYMLAEFNSRVVQGYRLSHSVSIDYILLNVAPAILMSMALYAWANWSLFTSAAALKEQAPEHAAALIRSHVLVIVSMIGACCAVATEVFDPTTLEAATWSSHWLCAGGFRQIAFFFLFVVAMAIWFPRDSLLGYNYEVAGDGRDGETIGVLEEIESAHEAEAEAAHE